jgi:uncharacterized protein
MERQSTPTGRSRAISALELLAGSAIVIGHNVFRVVPNEVVILFVVGWISLRIRDRGWQSVGLVRPPNWLRIVLIGIGLGILNQVLSEYATVPLVQHFMGQTPNLEEFKPLIGNLKRALISLVVVWTFAAFGEEMVYRGYLLRRAADVGKRSNLAYWLGLTYISLLFGVGHYYQGPAGVIDTAMSSVIFGSAYLLCGRNLWVAILGHGFSNTIAIGLVYFNLVPSLR